MKIRVLIVEDDKYFRYAVKRIIDWEKYGFVIAGEAVHGSAALEFMEHEAVDVVVTDMSMPIMNGIKLTKIIKERYPEVMVIALSAYDDFEFVKESLRLGASDYILKQNMENEDAAKKIYAEWIKHIKKLLQEESVREKFLSWIRGDESIAEGVEKYIQFCIGSYSWYLCIVENLNQSWIGSQCGQSQWMKESLLELSGKNEHILIFPSIQNPSEAIRIESRNRLLGELDGLIEKERYLAGCSGPSTGMRRMPEKYRQVKELLEYGCFQKKQKILVWEEACFIERVLDFEENKKEFQNIYDLEKAEKSLLQLAEKLRRHMPKEEYVQKNLLLFLQEIGANLGYEMGNMEFAEIKQELSQRRMLTDKLSYVQRHMEKAYEEKKKRTQHNAVFRAIQYMKEHYREELSLGEIAADAAVNESYLSYLFSREAGMTVIEYLNCIRIDMAKELIRNTNLKSYEIGDAVGISNASYFSTLFRKRTGQSVREYRRNAKNK